MNPFPRSFESGPARPAVGAFPFNHRTVAEMDALDVRDPMARREQSQRISDPDLKLIHGGAS